MISNFNRKLGDFVAFGYVIVFVLTFYEVLARYLFNAPTQWTLEVVLTLAGLHYFLCGPQVSADDKHISVTTITDRLSPRARGVLQTFGIIVSAISCVVLAWGAWKQLAFSMKINERSGTLLNSHMPMILKAALLVAVVLMVVQFATRIFRRDA